MSNPASARSGKPLIIGLTVGVVTVAMVVLGIVFIPKLFLPKPDDSGSAPVPSLTQTQETPQVQPVEVAATFVDGAKVAWSKERKEFYNDDRITFGYGFTDFGDFSLIPMAEWELIGSGGQDGALLAVNQAGKVIWKLSDAADWECAEQYFFGQLVCVHQRDPKGTLEYISPESGQTLKSVSLDFWPTLVSVAGDIVVVSGFDIRLGDDYRSTPHVSGYDDAGSMLWEQKINAQCTPWEDADYSEVLSIGTALVVNFSDCVTLVLDPTDGEISDKSLSASLVDHAGILMAYLAVCNIGDNDDYWQSCPAGLVKKDELTLPDGQSIRIVYATGWGGYNKLAGTPWYITQEDESSCATTDVRKVDSDASVWKAPNGIFAVEMASPSTLISLTRGRLSAYNLAADKELWNTELQLFDADLDNCNGYQLFILDDQTVLVADSEGVTGFSLTDGRKLWDKMHPYPNVKYVSDKAKTHISWLPTAGPSLIARLNDDQLALIVPAQA
jgi:hypothetical protein